MGISFDNVSFNYRDGSLASQLGLNQLNLELTEGCMTAVLGTSGSGKSTLLQHMNGLLLPDEGSVHILEFKLKSGKQGDVPKGLRKKVGLVFQYPEQQLFESTVEQDLRFGPLNFGAPMEVAEKAAQLAGEAMGLDQELLDKNPFELSSGQMRKAAVAAVLASDPDILVLDEPTASLDPASRGELMTLLHKLCKEKGKTVIVVTHRLEEALPYADEFVVLSDGKAIFNGGAADLIDRQEVLKAAGIVLPCSLRMAGMIAERFAEQPADVHRSPAELADWIAAFVQGKGQQAFGEEE